MEWIGFVTHTNLFLKAMSKIVRVGNQPPFVGRQQRISVYRLDIQIYQAGKLILLGS